MKKTVTLALGLTMTLTLLGGCAADTPAQTAEIEATANTPQPVETTAVPSAEQAGCTLSFRVLSPRSSSSSTGAP